LGASWPSPPPPAPGRSPPAPAPAALGFSAPSSSPSLSPSSSSGAGPRGYTPAWMVEAPAPSKGARPGARIAAAGSSLGAALRSPVVLIALVFVAVAAAIASGWRRPAAAPAVTLTTPADIATRQVALVEQAHVEKNQLAAINLLTTAINLDPAHPAARDAFLARAKRYTETGETERARRDLLKLTRREDAKELLPEVEALLAELDKKAPPAQPPPPPTLPGASSPFVPAAEAPPSPSPSGLPGAVVPPAGLGASELGGPP
jgi:hypothetical protein